MSQALRERALRFLARREHTRAGLSRKLAPYAECAEDLDALLDDLVARQLLSDERCAEMRVNARRARFGNARLAQDLRTLGVAEELVGETLGACEAQHPELSRARQIWQRRFGDLRAASDLAERTRQTRFLMGRGFSAETIRRVLRGDFENE